ncbi:hypothetical protein LguiB_007212 [Lonicera macranthoides]
MASSSGSGTTSGSSLLQNSGSEEDLMNQRKRKRMISNRESARRSRMRKQKHLDDLAAQLSQLRKENSQIITGLSITTQHYHSVEAENSVLRAQVAELSHRLDSLNEIIAFLNASGGAGFVAEEEPADLFINNPLSYLCVNQPIMASADMMINSSWR